MHVVVIGKVVGVSAITHNKQLYKAEQGIGEAVAGVAFIAHDLLHGSARTHFQTLEFNLHNGNAVHEQNHIITVVAVLGVDAELIDDFKIILAPVLDVDQGIMQRSSVLTGKGVYFT